MTLKLALKGTDLNRAMARLGERAKPACARALNRATGSARTVLVREIATDMGLKSSVVREQIRVRQATAERLVSALEASGARIPLIDFKARGPEPSRGRGRGVSYRLPGGAARIGNAFIATMRSGHRGVFRRKARARLGIFELFGPSLPHVFEKVSPAAQARGEEQLAKNLAHEFKWALSGESN